MAAKKQRKRAKAEVAEDVGLRERLVSAALSLVKRDGASGVTLRAVGALAGVSRSAPYLHFESREALLAAVAAEGMRALAREMSEAKARAEGDAVSELRAMGVAYVTFAATHPSHFRVMFGPEVRGRGDYPGLKDAGRTVEALLGGTFSAAKRELKSPGLDPRIAALTAWSVVHGLASLWVDGRIEDVGLSAKDPKRLSEQVTDALLSAMLPIKRKKATKTS